MVQVHFLPAFYRPGISALAVNTTILMREVDKKITTKRIFLQVVVKSSIFQLYALC